MNKIWWCSVIFLMSGCSTINRRPITDRDILSETIRIYLDVNKYVIYKSEPDMVDNWQLYEDTTIAMEGDCEDIAFLLYHRLEDSNLKFDDSRVVFGVVLTSGKIYGHAWNEITIKDKTYMLDATNAVVAYNYMKPEYVKIDLTKLNFLTQRVFLLTIRDYYHRFNDAHPTENSPNIYYGNLKMTDDTIKKMLDDQNR